MLTPLCDGYEPSDDKPCLWYVSGGFCKLPMLFRCTEYLRVHEPVLSYSSMNSFVCPRKYYWSNIAGLEPVEKALPLEMGTVADKLLQIIHGQNDPVDFAGFFAPYRDDKEELKPWQYAMWGLFEGYASNDRFNGLKGNCQVEFNWRENGYPQIHGFTDLVTIGEDQIGYEFKYTQRPESYTKFTVSMQLATYFIGSPHLQRITLRAIQVPMLKQSAKETGVQYKDRVKLDFCGRPNHYINDTHYWRTEFDLGEVKERAKRIASTIRLFINQGGKEGFYQQIGPHTCFSPSRCNYLNICESGVVSENIYRKRGNKQLDEKEGTDVITG